MSPWEARQAEALWCSTSIDLCGHELFLLRSEESDTCLVRDSNGYGGGYGCGSVPMVSS